MIRTRVAILCSTAAVWLAACGGHPNMPVQLQAGNCVSCHADAATTPVIEHTAAQSQCATCHVVQTWSSVHYTHIAPFPLTGTHDALPCLSCHRGILAATSSTCSSCHQSAADTAAVVHSGLLAGDCEQCHTQTQWFPADLTFHDQAYSLVGTPHAALACSDCHTAPADYTAYSCLTCHAHSKDRMDRTHIFVPDYSYESMRCFACHRRGGRE